MIKELFQRFLRKEQDSEKIIFEMFYQRVYFTAHYIVKDDNVAQDVVQETFIKAFKHMHTVKDGEKLGAWLATIATRTAIDYLRNRKNWNDIATEDMVLEEQLSKDRLILSQVEIIVEEKFIKKLLFQELGNLNPDFKQVLILRYLYDMKNDEIAKTLHLNEITVRTRIYRAKQKLKKLIKKRLENGELTTYEK